MKEIERFMETVNQTFTPAMKEWKKKGGKIIGYTCTNVPEEIILAAGMLPYRVRAPESTSASLSQKYTTDQNCTFCRHVVDEALQGKYAFLDGFIGTNGCDQIRRVGDIFRAAVFKEPIQDKSFFMEFIAAPRVPSDMSLGYYQGEMMRVKEKMEEHFGIEITDDKLRSAIRETNESRRLLRELYELRKAEQPPITGTETLAVNIAYTTMPKAEFNAALETLLPKLRERKDIPEVRKRLFLYGSCMDDPKWIQVLEDLGGQVVADGLCIGARMFWDLVDGTKEPMEALAHRYLYRWACPRMTNPKARQDQVARIAKEWNVDGIVGERMMFCQLWGAERMISNLNKKEIGFPILWLDREYLFGGAAQMRTRIQAFMESMETL
jgi:benzoyl-CoA reductase subunit C